MGKVSRIVQLARHEEFPIKLGGLLVLVLGVISAGFGILDWHLQWTYGIGLLAITTAVAAIAILRKIDEPIISTEVVPDLAAGATRAKFHCPCDSNLRNRAKKLGSFHFDSRMNIESSVYDQLAKKNPLMLACLTDGKGELLGYFDAIPLEDAFAKMFLKGLFDETKIADEVVLPAQKMATCKYLYITGIAVANSTTPAGKMNGRILIWASLRYLKKYYGRSRPLAFAIATTKEGERLAELVGMSLDREEHSSTCRYKLYSMRLTSEAIDNVLSIVPDRASSCVLQWQDGNELLQTKSARRRETPRRHRKQSISKVPIQGTANNSSAL
jgi:hypothetical protein